jgi:hypothetical protein
MNQKSNINSSLLLFGLAILLIAIMAFQPFVPLGNLTRDPLVVAKGKFYFGALSSLGILGWMATSTVCLSTYYMLNDSRDKKTRSFFLFSGLFTLFLLFDDLFMMHEVIFPKYLGINEKVVLALYPVLSMFLLINYRGRIARSSYVRLFIAFAFLGLSNVVDTIFPQVNSFNLLFEDGFKFLGIVGWAIYFFDTAFTVLNYEIKRPKNRMMPKVFKPEVITDTPEFSNN